MPKKTLPAWATVGARVLIRSSTYGARIPATAQRGSIVEITSAGLLWVRTDLEQIALDTLAAHGARPISKHSRASRYQIGADNLGAFEFEKLIGYQRRSLRPDTPENRKAWSQEMSNHAARMVEQRRSERKRELSTSCCAKALRARRLAALEKLSHLWAVDQADHDASVDELIEFVRGVIGRSDNE